MKMMKFPSTEQLEVLPTLAQGQATDLKIDTGLYRVSLSRCDLYDGEPFHSTVYVEVLTADGRWIDVGYYDGDEPIECLQDCQGREFAAEMEYADELISLREWLEEERLNAVTVEWEGKL